MPYRRCGNSGLQLPLLSLGLWHNFGVNDDFEKCRDIVHTAFDKGITHIDLANNYGPPAGGAEITFGKIFAQDLRAHRDELIISTKAGYRMWEGPYGDGGSRKYLLASLDQSLQRMGLDYVDIFYHHRPDPSTPLEESMMALHTAVQSGKALYVGISSYSPEETKQAAAVLASLGTPLLVHQARYSMLDRQVENGLLDAVQEEGMGLTTFSSLAQGILTSKYLQGIPADSRAASNRGNGALEKERLTPEILQKVRMLNEMAEARGQSLASMALAWVLRDERVTSAIIGASRPDQVTDALRSVEASSFTEAEQEKIDGILR